MKALRVGLKAGAAVLLVSTAICGLWIRGQGAAVDPSSVSFHMTIGLLTVVVGLLALSIGSFAKAERPVSRTAGESVGSSSASEILVRGR